MKSKKLLFGIALSSLACSIAIGVTTKIVYDYVEDSVSAEPLNAPSFLSDTDLRINTSYYFYFNMDLLLSNSIYSYLPSVNALFGGFVDTVEFPFYPSVSYDSETFNSLYLYRSIHGAIVNYHLVIGGTDTFEFVSYSKRMSNGSYHINLPSYFISDIALYKAVFDGSHYLIWDNSLDVNDTTNKIAFTNLVSCFGVNSVRNIQFNIVDTSYAVFPMNYIEKINVPKYDVSDYYSNTSRFIDPYQGVHTYDDYDYYDYVFVPVFDGLISYRGDVYHDIYAVFRSWLCYDFYCIGDTQNQYNTYSYAPHTLGYEGTYWFFGYCLGSFDDYITPNFIGNVVDVKDVDDGTKWVYMPKSFHWSSNYFTFDILFMTTYISYEFWFADNFFAYWTYIQPDYINNFSYIRIDLVVDGGGAIITSFYLLSTAFTGLAGLLNFVVIPGITIGMIVLIPFLVTVILFVIKLFKR